MSDAPVGFVAVVDYGMGNLFSVKQACQHAGLTAVITASKAEILAADAVILPGVGAFGDAMETLTRMDLVSVLRDFASSPKPMLGICLGMQLLMTESHEFGRHRGLDVVEGEVTRLPDSHDGRRQVKVPQVGWNRVHFNGTGCSQVSAETGPRANEEPLLNGVSDGEYMYFVHSFYPIPADSSVIVSTTQYGSVDFCSSLRSGNVFACQFHPERSGQAGLRIYHNFARLINGSESKRLHA